MPQREYPRYDIRTVTRADSGYAAFLIDHETGNTWLLDADLSWKPIKRQKKSADPKSSLKRVIARERRLAKAKKNK